LKAKSTIDRFAFERRLLHHGTHGIAGVDEAGRGPLAGPVLAAAAILPNEWVHDGLPPELKGLDDSKQLSEHQRELFSDFIHACGEIRFGIGQCDPATIDELNILQATHRAMNDALSQLHPRPAHVLVDGLRVKSLRLPHTALVKGDARSYSIAAASVLAKVTRDRLMKDFDHEYPQYGFAEHKGYGTPRHLAALAEHGPCPIHRLSFAPLRVGQAELFEIP
jgi:ribonuclease HII